jgi:nucleoside-diphosphate-sugar epimerase
MLLTGVAGFTGRYLANTLSKAGHEVQGISHHTPAASIEGLTRLHVCDLNDADHLDAVVREVRPDCIAHLGAISFVAHDDIEGIYRTNIIGTRNLLHAAATLGGVQALLLASSANVYGNQTGGALDEDSVPWPVNDYGVSKISMEYVAKIYSEQLPIITVRPFNYTGVGQSTSFIIPKIISKVKRGERRIELGNLDIARDFSDVRDVVNAYHSLLNEPRAIGETFNICSGQPRSLADLLQLIREISHHDFEVSINPEFVRENEVETLWGDRSKLDRFIRERPQYELRDTVEWMLQ